MKVRFHELAQAELDDAFEWYEGQFVGLGLRFIEELDQAVSRILEFPAISPEIDSGLRRCILPRFPYGIIYSVDETWLTVVAVAHLHREPRYWVERL